MVVQLILFTAKFGNATQLSNSYLVFLYCFGRGVPEDTNKARESLSLVPWLYAACIACEAHESFPYLYFLLIR